MVAEMVPEKVLQPRAFSIMPMVWSIGSVFGPSFGGFFAKPAEQWPSIFGRSELLKRYPFLLPNLLASVFFMISIFVATLFLKETLESKRHKKDWGLRLGEKLTRTFQPRQRRPRARQHRRSFVDAEATAPLLSAADRSSSDSSIPSVSSSRGSKETLFTRPIVVALVCYTFLALHSVAYDQVLPVFLNYPTLQPGDPKGPIKFAAGFGLPSDKIGAIYTIYGVACGIIQFVLFPKLCARFGVLGCYRAAAFAFPVVYVVTPFTALIESTTLRYAALMAILLLKGFCVIVAFPCNTILLTNAAPSLRVLGTLNGFATTVSGVGRAAGPALTGAAFSWGVERGYVVVGWWVLAAIAAVGAVPPFWLEDGEGPSGSGGKMAEGEGGEEADGTILAEDPTESEDLLDLMEEAVEETDDEGNSGTRQGVIMGSVSPKVKSGAGWN
jgi:hypothetical protein